MFGRSDRCDFVLEHPTVSRYHAGMVNLRVLSFSRRCFLRSSTAVKYSGNQHHS
jgi:hypothetical protein